MRSFLYVFSFLFFSSTQTVWSDVGVEKPFARDKKLFESYVDASLNLYNLSPECFFPYKNLKIRTEMGTRRNMRAALCSGRMESFCQKRKDLVESVFKEKFPAFKFRARRFETQCTVTQDIEDHFAKIRQQLKERQNHFLRRSRSYLEKGGLYQNSQELLEGLKKGRDKVYHSENFMPKDLTEEILTGKSKILFSETLLRFARGDYYELEDVDLIEAFDQELSDMKKAFLKERREEGRRRSVRFGLDRIRSRRSLLKYAEVTPEYRFDESSTADLLKSFYVPDDQVVDLILRRRLQRAVWHLRTIGERKKARELEEIIKQEILSKNKLSKITGLNLGFTESYRVYFETGESVVYKPESKVNIASGSNQEVASYLVDRMLNINMVPLTFLMDYKEGQLGSSQFFVAEARVARTVSEYNGSAAGKLDRPSGRNTKTPKILLFDWLTSNRDRNLDNYMFLDTGKIVFIDHGLSFFADFRPRHLTKRFVMKRLPSLELHERMKALSLKREHIFKKLKPYLPERKIETFYVKLKLFVKKVDLLLKKGEITLESENTTLNPPA